MIGIYKITNTVNNKVYIGQSIDIETRWKNHKKEYHREDLVYLAIQKHGLESFKFEVLELCLPEELNDKEKQYIREYESDMIGYNILPGGQQNYGENNPMAKLKEEDVIFIRKLYASQTEITKRELYNKYFKDKVGWRGFEKAWSGETWKYIMPEVYSEENKNFYNTTKKSRKGEQNGFTKVNDEEVIKMRLRYVNETTDEILQDYKDILTYAGLENILTGRTYSHLPIYRKRLKTWINK